MCGITGIIDRKGQKSVAPVDLKAMTDRLYHRGPDGEGYVLFDEQGPTIVGSTDTPTAVWGKDLSYSPTRQVDDIKDKRSYLGLGHRRLSIIDLSWHGHQPICDQDKKYWLVYNGEIYNYIELREELKTLGHTFHTGTDTEVLLCAYLQWGKDCLSRLNGMFAFVIYNTIEQTVFGARDRFGVKPLYYYLDEEHFAFASEQKALLALPFVSKQVNREAVFDLFILGQLEMEREGLFQGIHELQPSECFELNLSSGNFKTARYYELPVNRAFEPFEAAKASGYIEATNALIQQAVRLRLRSDVRVGSCLSGGLDSSAIVCLIHQFLQAEKLDQVGDQLQVFTSSFEDKQFDESQWAKLVADQTTAGWHQVFPNKEGLLADLEDMTWSQDIPVWSSSTYAQYSVMRLVAEQGVKVVLDGQGGDELFAGYQQYYFNYWMELLKHQQFGKLWQALQQNGSLQGNTGYLFRTWLKQFLFTRLPKALRENLYKRIYPEFQYLHPDIWHQYKHRLDQFQSSSTGSLNQELQDQFSRSLLKNLLKCEDRNAMRFSIESRTPFSDDLPLIEYIFGLPSAYKIHDGITKYLLRESMKGILPEPVRNRQDKMGYVTPNNRWLREIKVDIKPYFEQPQLQDYLNMPQLQKDFDVLFDLSHDTENFRSWKFLNFAVWVRVFGMG